MWLLDEKMPKIERMLNAVVTSGGNKCDAMQSNLLTTNYCG
jgi:hypothetical protein